MTKPDNLTAVKSLKPAAVWHYFAEIAAVPRPSKQEEQIRAHMRALGQELGFKTREDRVGNMVLEVPAKPGCERAPLTVLQGHLDMVCEKNSGTDHDFDREGIRLIVEQDAQTGEQVVRGDGTTLGADNGIGLAMALAAATSPDVKHGPLEILCTIDEEMGMTGAGALEPGFFHGQRLINLDSEDDHVIYIGCAGGGDATLTWEFKTQPIEAGLEVGCVSVSGLRGGHSGGDIHENRANANKVLVRTLSAADVTGLRLISITGGSKRNAIAREAQAVVAAPRETLAALRRSAAEVCEAVKRESAEPNAAITVESGQGAAALSVEDTQRLLRALMALPHGVLEMHQKVAGLVQTSSNVGTIVCEPLNGQGGLRVVVGNLSRSSMPGRIAATWAQIAAVGQLAGAIVKTGNQYPGWNPNPDSPLLKKCSGIYERLFGEKPNVTAIHAGLECGIIGERVGNLDMVSIGPRITGPHSPDERTYPASVEKTYKFLTAILAELAQG
jgi:dipeptidase D